MGLVSCVACAAGCRSVPTPAQDRRSILQLLDEQAGAWNRGDLAAFMQGYWRSPDLVFTSGGRVQRGYAAIAQRYRAAYPDGAAMGNLTFSDLEIRLLRPDAAWVLGRWALHREAAEGRDPDPGGVFTLVLHRFGDHWRIIHDHTSSLDE